MVYISDAPGLGVDFDEAEAALYDCAVLSPDTLS